MNPYEIDPDPATDPCGEPVWLYCPACSATFPVAPLGEMSCPNGDQDGHAAPDGLPGPPSIAEIAALTGRLRHLRSPDATEAERAAFLADKHELLARCTPPLSETRKD